MAIQCAKLAANWPDQGDVLLLRPSATPNACLLILSFTLNRLSPQRGRLIYDQSHHGGAPVNRHSPDESQTGINVRVSPALLQDRREVLTATSTSGNPNA